MWDECGAGSVMAYGSNNWAPFIGYLNWPALLLWAAIIGFVLFLIARLVAAKWNRRRSHDTDSFELLKTRLANGEISLEEYQRVRAILLR
jgi:uncharacterized membrane protein